MPDGRRVDDLVRQAHDRYSEVSDGALSGVNSVLADADPRHLGIALTGADGVIHEVGDSRVAFTLMSVSKPYVFALACEWVGTAQVRRLVGVNATGLPFTSAQAVERARDGRTNPMVNPGAIATTSLLPGTSPGDRWDRLASGLSRFAGRRLELDPDTLTSARATNVRNRALAMLLQEAGALSGDALDAVDLSTLQCGRRPGDASRDEHRRDVRGLGGLVASRPPGTSRASSASTCSGPSRRRASGRRGRGAATHRSCAARPRPRSRDRPGGCRARSRPGCPG